MPLVLTLPGEEHLFAAARIQGNEQVCTEVPVANLQLCIVHVFLQTHKGGQQSQACIDLACRRRVRMLNGPS